MGENSHTNYRQSVLYIKAGLQNRHDPDYTTFIKHKIIKKVKRLNNFDGCDNMPECTTSGFNKI